MSELATVVQKIVERITPAVAEIVNSRGTGTIELHFSDGKYQKGRKDLSL